jgi:hypothetical protein
VSGTPATCLWYFSLLGERSRDVGFGCAPCKAAAERTRSAQRTIEDFVPRAEIHLFSLGTANLAGQMRSNSPDTRVARRPTPFNERWIDAWRRNGASRRCSGNRPPLSTRSNASSSMECEARFTKWGSGHFLFGIFLTSSRLAR